jgi:dihydroorotate dehydrogenase
MGWRILRALLFRLDAERAHHLAMALFSALASLPLVGAALARWGRPPASLRTTRLGRELASPVGLAAGFDKDARWVGPLSRLGFGFLEVGTVTAHAQPGNPRPRLFRLPTDRALVNRFGFNNAGSDALRERLAIRPRDVVLGVNLGKSKATPNEDAAADYLASFDRVRAFADYVVVNVSSPNTPGLRQLQDREALASILAVLVARNRDGAVKPVPLLVKVAPDLADEALREVVELALSVGLDGVVATNTTVSREGLSTPRDVVEGAGAGGLSGAPLTLRSREAVRKIRRWSGGRLLVVGVGGVCSADDAWEMLRAGADLVQVYTGFVYGGPGFVRRLNAALAARLEAEGLSLPELVGSGAGT